MNTEMHVVGDRVFYILLLIPILLEIYRIVYLNKSFEIYNSKDESYKGMQSNPSLLLYLTMDLVYFILILSGLFTPQWILFGMIMFLSFWTKPSKLFYLLDSIICLFILVFIILDKFHHYLT